MVKIDKKNEFFRINILKSKSNDNHVVIINSNQEGVLTFANFDDEESAIKAAELLAGFLDTQDLNFSVEFNESRLNIITGTIPAGVI